MTGRIRIIQVPGDPNRLVLSADFQHLSPVALFDFFTIPELLERWWAEQADVEPRLGGAYRMRWPTRGWELAGVYTRFEPGQALSFTWRWIQLPDLPEQTVDLVIQPEGEGCQVTLTQSDFNETLSLYEDHGKPLKGWVHFFGRLLAQSSGGE